MQWKQLMLKSRGPSNIFEIIDFKLKKIYNKIRMSNHTLEIKSGRAQNSLRQVNVMLVMHWKIKYISF